MERICARIWIGDAHDGRNPESLRAAGISAVMNATAETDSLDRREFRCLRLNQADGAEIPHATLTRFFDWMETSMRQGHTVLIHCGAGVSRASSFTIAWLMSVGFAWEEAESMIRAVRPVIQPNPILKASVLAYCEALCERHAGQRPMA